MAVLITCADCGEQRRHEARELCRSCYERRRRYGTPRDRGTDEVAVAEQRQAIIYRRKVLSEKKYDLARLTRAAMAADAKGNATYKAELLAIVEELKADIAENKAMLAELEMQPAGDEAGVA